MHDRRQLSVVVLEHRGSVSPGARKQALANSWARVLFRGAGGWADVELEQSGEVVEWMSWHWVVPNELLSDQSVEISETLAEEPLVSSSSAGASSCSLRNSGNGWNLWRGWLEKLWGIVQVGVHLKPMALHNNLGHKVKPKNGSKE